MQYAINKSISNNVAEGSLMDHYYDDANTMLDHMKKMNKAWHTRDAEVVASASTRNLSEKEL